jgi:hydroxymethylbilane synthase
VSRSITIATRGSDLALWQARHVREQILAVDGALDVKLLIIKTRGDAILDVPLSQVGGKGLFVKEIEEALRDGRADLAVHSMKDVPSELAPGLVLAAVSKRADPRDALCARGNIKLSDLPRGARVGTSSLRRACQLRAARPDFDILSVRGNVPTRLKKLHAGEFDAIILAVSGLTRLGLDQEITEALSPETCLPAVGQGVLGVEIREDDGSTRDLVVAAVHFAPDAQRVAAERAFLAHVEGGCQAPLAAFAEFESDSRLRLRALIGTPDGSTLLVADQKGPAHSPEELGVRVASDLLSRGGQDILRALPPI